MSPPPEDLVVDLPADTKRVAVAAGRVLALRASGELVSARPCERFAPVASHVEDLVEDGASVHLIAGDADGTSSPERHRCVLRFDGTTAALTEEVILANGTLAPGEHLLWAADGGAVIQGDGGLSLVTRSEKRTLGGAGDRLVRAPGGALLLAASGDRIMKLCSRQGSIEGETVPLPLTVSALAPGPDGTYAIGDKGVLILIGADDRPVRVHHRLAVRADAEALLEGKKCERVCRSLREVPGGVLVETDMDTVLLRPDQAPLHLAPAGRDAPILIDGQSGELYSVAGAVLRRYDAEKTAWVKVRFKEAAPR